MKYFVWQLLMFCFIQNVFCSSKLPLVLTTWKFTNATIKAWEVINTPDKTNVDAVVEGCSVCEREQCGTTVGYGGSPDEHGETTLDAMVMDGETMNVGAVAGLRRVKDVISVARHVLEHTKHTLLAGDLATEFARMMGFKEESLVTPKSKNMWKQWRNDNCQPNFWTNVVPDPNKQCGPYKPTKLGFENLRDHNFGSRNHDTIGMIVMDENGSVVAGTSTNGAKYKIPGRVGDSPIAGAGAYADNEAGAAVATGDGDVMMRFLPSFLAVEGLKSGLNTSQAAKRSIQRIRKHYPNFRGAVIVANINGEFSASCSGMDVFPFTYYQKGMDKFGSKTIPCIN